jgi:hypothetical protein
MLTDSGILSYEEGSSVERCLVVYHSADLDGILSGRLALDHLLSLGKDVDYLGWDYGDGFDLESFTPYQEIWILDLDMGGIGNMLLLSENCRLYWFDHHKTAYNDYLLHKNIFKANGSVVVFPDERDFLHSTTDLLYRYIHKRYPGKSENLLELGFYYLGRYDIWDKSDEALWKDYILPYQLGLGFYITSIDCAEAMDYEGFMGNKSGYNKIMDAGKRLLEIRRLKGLKLAERVVERVWDTKLGSFRCLVGNTSENGSFYFESLLEQANSEGKEIDLCINWYYNGKEYCYGIYRGNTNKADCGNIARSFGGGGHAGAAGFSSIAMLF